MNSYESIPDINSAAEDNEAMLFPLSTTTAIVSSTANDTNEDGGGKRTHHHRLWVVVTAALVLSIVLILGVVSHSSTAIIPSNQEESGASMMIHDIPMLERVKKETSSTSAITKTTALPPASLLPSPACTFMECSKSCDHIEAPYLCLTHNGGPHGGCSSTPWVVGTCTTSCDQRECDTLKIPDDMKSCEGVSCMNTDECTCEHDAPYQCLEGSAAHGCSDESYHWTAYTSVETCSKCCDTRTCK